MWPASCFTVMVGTVPKCILIAASKSCWHSHWHVLLVRAVAVVTFRREDGARLVAIARLVQDSTTSLVDTFRWSLVCVFSMRGQWIFKILSSLTCGSAFVTCFPFNFGVRKPHFHEGPAVRLDSFMVALPTRAYVEGV